eukprot:239698-Chlamydomonas_euryale.AAC.2
MAPQAWRQWCGRAQLRVCPALQGATSVISGQTAPENMHLVKMRPVTHTGLPPQDLSSCVDSQRHSTGF